MKINVVKRKAASGRELSRVPYEIPDVKYLHELLYEIMTAEMSGTPDLSSAGKIAYEPYSDKKYTAEQAWDILKQDFEDGLFRVFFNEEEYKNLDDILNIKEENELIIIKLVMMAGRLW